MAVPIVPDLVAVKAGDGATTEVFTTICGINSANITETVETSTRSLRDCVNVGLPGVAQVIVGGSGWTISGTGPVNTAELAVVRPMIGKKKNYKWELLQQDGTNAGKLLGTFAGNAVLNSNEMGVQDGSDSTWSLGWQGSGALVYTPAP